MAFDQGSLMDQERRESALGRMYDAIDESDTRAAQKERDRVREQRELFAKLDAFWQADLESRA